MPITRSVSENPVVGPRASISSTGKDGEAGDIDAYRRCSRTQSSRRTSRSKPDRILRQAPRGKVGLYPIEKRGSSTYHACDDIGISTNAASIKELTHMAKTSKAKKKPLSKGERIHVRRLKQLSRRPEIDAPAPKED